MQLVPVMSYNKMKKSMWFESWFYLYRNWRHAQYQYMTLLIYLLPQRWTNTLINYNISHGEQNKGGTYYAWSWHYWLCWPLLHIQVHWFLHFADEILTAWSMKNANIDPKHCILFWCFVDYAIHKLKLLKLENLWNFSLTNLKPCGRYLYALWLYLYRLTDHCLIKGLPCRSEG